jgi:hypothetical protein
MPASKDEIRETLEEDIEPLLLRLWKIEKTAQWRCLREHRNTLFS